MQWTHQVSGEKILLKTEKTRRAPRILIISCALLLLASPLFAAQENAVNKPTRETITLNGTWKIAFDPDNVGKTQRWYETLSAPTEPIRVPSVWNEIRPNYQGVAWYETAFATPRYAKGSSVRIYFGAVSYLAEVWLNGKYLGSHEGGYTPFEVDAMDALSGDQPNRLVVRVLLPMRTQQFMSGLKWQIGKRIDGLVLEEIPASKQIWYDNFGGIWQDVHIEVTHTIWVKDCFVRPDIYSGKINATCTISNRSGEAASVALGITVSGKVRPAASGEQAQISTQAQLANGDNLIDFSVPIPHAHLWSPDDPFLYRLSIGVLASGEVAASGEFTFGMRDFTIRENQFFLNGKPIIVKAAIYQPHYPQTLAYPPSPDMLDQDIRMAKAAHLNMLRLHIKPQLPRLLKLADEQGILLYEEPPIGWIQKSAAMRDRCRRELRELIARDRNHPALVMWGALNEGAAEGEELKAELAAYAHELDPTRLVFDDSGGVYYSGENSRVYIPGTTLARSINDIHPYMLQPFSNVAFSYYRQIQEPHLFNFTSEFGAMGGIEDLDAVIARYDPSREWQDKDRLTDLYAMFKHGFSDLGLDKAFGDFATLARSSRDAQAEALTRMIDALRLNPLTAGYDICHWNDAGFEIAFGLLDEWRNPKPAYDAATAANQPLHAIVATSRSNFYAGESVEGELTLINDEQRQGRVAINQEITSGDGRVLQSQTRDALLDPRIQAFGRFRLPAPATEGNYRLVATVTLDGKRVEQSGRNILVLKRLLPRAEREAKFAVLDPGGRLAGRLTNLPIPATTYIAATPRQSVYIVGPIADSLYDYPLGQLKGLVEMARRGATLVLFELPMDSGEVSEKFGVFPFPLTVAFPEGFKLQWIRDHAMTAGLPSNLVLDQRYADILPERFLDMKADEIVGGMLIDSFGNYNQRWTHSLVVNRVDKGHIIICQYRLLENLGKDPLADRMLVNILNYAQSIAHKPDATLSDDQQRAFNQQVAEKQSQVQGEMQRWAVAGPFDNPNRDGLYRESPPEKGFRFEQTFAGKNGRVTWKPVTVWKSEKYNVNLGTRYDDWTVHYAYTNLYSPVDEQTQMKLNCQQGCRLWLDGRELIGSNVFGPNENTVVPVTLHSGWNPLLVKVDRTKMQHAWFMLDMRTKSGELVPGLKFDFAGSTSTNLRAETQRRGEKTNTR